MLLKNLSSNSEVLKSLKISSTTQYWCWFLLQKSCNRQQDFFHIYCNKLYLAGTKYILKITLQVSTHLTKWISILKKGCKWQPSGIWISGRYSSIYISPNHKEFTTIQILKRTKSNAKKCLFCFEELFFSIQNCGIRLSL